MNMNVKLIDYTKDGANKIASIARATRKDELDYKETPKDLGTPVSRYYNKRKKKREKDEEFIETLLSVEHYGILEHIQFTFHVSDISRVTTHQLVRHRIASYLQQSSRHTKPGIGEYVVPDTINNGSIEAEVTYKDFIEQAFHTYNKLLKEGVPKEDARYMLPPAYFAHISITMNARALRHFLELRLDKSAQWEIREMACRIFDIVYNLYPVMFEDLKELREENEKM